STIEFPIVPRPAGLVAAFYNTGAAPLELSVVVALSGQRSNEQTAIMRELVSAPVRDMERYWKLPNFKIFVRPCGGVNAYSNPDIVICSELINDLVRKNLADAIDPILFHEMAHSILFLWGLPGYDNEDVADDFSAAFVGKFPSYVD